MLSIIVAMSENRVIGRGGTLPWHLSTDLRRFKRLTTGGAIIMGRKTFESIGRALPDRLNIVISRTIERSPSDDVIVVGSLDEAIDAAERGESATAESDIFIIGGEAVYRAAIGRVERIHLTLVHTLIDDGDAFFPELGAAAWRIAYEDRIPAGDRDDHPTTYRVLERH